MKKLNNNGFSLVEILTAIAILAVLMMMATSAYNVYKKKAKQQAYDTMALSAKSAAENYNIENPNILTVSLQTLWEEQYIDTIEDPGKKTQNCTGKVTIEKVESVEDKKLDMNKYTVNICCRKYNYTYIFPEGTKTEDDSCKS